MNKSVRTRRPGHRRGPALLAALVGAAVLLTAPGVSEAKADPEQPVGGALLGSRGVVRPEGTDVPTLPKVKASAYVVTDLETGKVLAAKDPHGTYAPASTLKVLTALTTLPYVDPKQQVKPTLADMSVDGTKVGVDRRRTYTAHSLFQAMLMMSANDATAAVARAAGGSGGQLKTVARMNAEARRLQAYDTVAYKPTGLDAKGQTSSAYDLTLIFRAAMQRKDFRTYTSTEQARFPALKKSKTYQISSHDRLLTDYPGMLGGKNGYTTKAKASYVGAAKRGGHTIGVTIMRTEGVNLWPETKKLLNWGFAARSAAVPIGDLVGARPKAASPTASASKTADVTEKDQAVTPLDDTGGLPPWLPPLGLAAAVLLCALVAIMAISGRRAAAPAGNGRRRGGSRGRRARSPAHAPQPARAASQGRRGHRRATNHRAAPPRTGQRHDSGITASYPMWPND